MTATSLRFCATPGCETVTTTALCFACERGETPDKRDVATMDRDELMAHEEMLAEFPAEDHEIVDRRGHVVMIGTRAHCLRFYAIGRGEIVRPRHTGVGRFLADFAQQFPSEITK